jgi:threonine synthase
MELICTSCKKAHPFDEPLQKCGCGEPLEVNTIEGSVKRGRTVWDRFKEFFPFFGIDLMRKYSLGEGDTPVVEVPEISDSLKNKVLLKNETLNPTWSFKDRGTLIGVIRAINLGFSKIGTVSTGNMAASVSAYGARANLETTVLVKTDIPEEKIYPILIYGSRLIEVSAPFGEIYRKSLEVGVRKGVYFINSDEPFRIEGYKTIGFEIAEYFDYHIDADYIVVPTGAGGLLRGIYKSLKELKESGLIDRIPRFISVQAEGCAPIVTAFEEDRKVIPVQNPKTIAGAIADPYPPSGNEVLRIIRDNGLAISVTDEEILESQEFLARYGIFVQPASAVTIACIRKLSNSGIRGKKFLSVLTGSGLKVISTAEKIVKKRKIEIPKTHLDKLENLL